MATLLQRLGTFRDTERPRKTLLNLNEQRTESQFCDVVLKVCGTQIYAHASVLAAASPYFRSFLGTGSDCPRVFSQKQPQVIEIHIDSMLISEGDGGYGEAVCKVVDYIYTNEIIITTSLFAQIIEIGRIMLLDQLILYCEEFQKGVDGNKPKDASTCTSTLKVVVDLLGPREYSLKCVDAQTETEESLFDKIKDDPPEILDIHANEKDTILEMDTNDAPRPENPRLDASSESEKFITKNDSLIPPPSQIKDDAKVELSDTLQSDDSECCKAIDSSKIREKVIVSEDKISETVPSEQEPVEDFNAIQSFEDILEYDATVIGPSNALSAVNAGTGSLFTLEKPIINEQSEEAVAAVVTEGELQDISDLVTFNSVSSTSLSVQAVPKSRGTGRPRGRPRKRRRGRPKGRREVYRDEADDAGSDYEFEQFMDKLEKGENVDLELQENEESVKEEADGREGESCSNPPVALKKSDRIRSRPLQLKKDYILHSLSRKTRKKFGRTLQDRRPIASSQTMTTEKKGNVLRFVCKKCDYSTTVFKNYVVHVKEHPDQDLKKCFLCSQCGFKTTKSRQFKRHKEKHMAEDLICPLCLFQAPSQSEYTEHKLKHSGNLPYFCDECDSRFKKRCQLESHKPKHWLQKPFTCPVCATGFKWKHALKNHMIVHSTVKNHLCDICGYATAHKSMLTAHSLIHTGQTLKCSVEGCLFEATKRQKLKMHMLTHTREKPHQCDVCGQRFSLAKNMRRHLLLHTNNRPYACKICSFKTTRYDKLKDHNHKLHNIGGPSVSRKAPSLLPSSENVHQTATIMTAENITLNPDGTISAESLQKIAELAAAQQAIPVCATGPSQFKSDETIINITQPSPTNGQEDNFPIIAHIHYSSNTVKEEEEGTVQYFQAIE